MRFILMALTTMCSADPVSLQEMEQMEQAAVREISVLMVLSDHRVGSDKKTGMEASAVMQVVVVVAPAMRAPTLVAMEEMAEITALQVVYSGAVLHRRECPVFQVVV